MTGDVSVPLHLTVHVLGLTVALGLAVFAVARRHEVGPTWGGVATGGLLLALTHVAVGSTWALEASWPIYARAAGYAGVAVGAAGRLVGGPAVIAAAPLSAHVAAAVAGVAAAVAALRGVLARGQSTLLLAVGLVVWAASDGLASELRVAAGAVHVVGSAAVGTWLVARARAALMTRFLTAFLVVLLVLVVGLSVAGGVIFTADLEREQLDGLQQVATARTTQWETEWPQELSTFGQVFSSAGVAERLREAAETGADVDITARTIAGLPGVDAAVLLSLDGRALGSHDLARGGPLAREDELLLAGHPIVTQALTGDATTGVVALGQRDLLAAAGVPVVPTVGGTERHDLRAGVLVTLRRVTDPRVLNDIVTLTDAEATVLLGDEVGASTLPAELHASLAEAVRAGGGSRVVAFEDGPRFVVVQPVLGADGQTVGRLALTLDASTVAGVERDLTRSLFWAVVAGLVVAALLSAGVARRITRPVTELTGAAERVAQGDLDTRVDLDQPDEIGRLAAAFNAMTGALQQRERDLVSAATTEAELRGQLEVVTASMGEALLAVDRDGRIRTANPAAAELLGKDRDRLLGQRLRRVLRGRDETGTELVDVLGGPDDRGTARSRAGLGAGRRLRPVAATAAPLVSQDGNHLGRVYVLRDISGEVEVERMKTEFLSNISHELRTPLTPIKGYAEVMRAKQLTPERVTDFAGNIAAAAGQLERIIGMLVDFASLEAGRMEVKLKSVDVSDEVNVVLERWRTRHPDRRFSRRLSRDLPPVQVDPDLLIRVLEELIDNAVKFSAGPVRIQGVQEGAHRVRLTVRDSGSGIGREELEVILRDFHQVDGSATRRVGGLGLGLSIVQRIVERFSGEVVIESEVGQGTDVHLLLPIGEGAG